MFGGTWLLQVAILLRKNYLLSKRDWKNTAMMVLAPVFFVLLLLILQFTAKDKLADAHPDREAVPLMPRCKAHVEDYCYSMAFAPNTSDYAWEVMQRVAQMNQLEIVRGRPKDAPAGAIVGFESEYDFTDWAKDNPNITQAALVFLPNGEPDAINNSSCYYYPGRNCCIYQNGSQADVYCPDSYVRIYYNTSCPNILGDCPDLRAQTFTALTRALMEQFAVESNSSKYDGVGFNTFSNAATSYPIITPPNVAVRDLGILFYYSGIMFFFLILLYQIVFEKEHKLRQGMKMMGLRDSTYWVSWFIHSNLLNILSVLFIIAAGAACQFDFFLNTNFFVLFFVFYIFILAMCQLAFWLSTLIPNTKSAIMSGITVFILGLLLQLVISASSAFIIGQLYKKQPAAQLFLWLFTFFPPFNFAKCVIDINNKALSFGAVPAEGYHWADLTRTRTINGTEIPSTSYSLLWQLYLAIFFSVFTWYCDHVVPGVSGAAHPPWFFLLPSYWGYHSKHTVNEWAMAATATSSSTSNNSVQDEDVVKEVQRAATGKGLVGNVALRVINLSKRYQSYPFVQTKSDVYALRGISLALEEGTVFALLGHNGAGKSTTVSIVTGLFPPTTGDAFIGGHSVVHEIDSVRAMIGVCPQHDILWDQLTAREHLEIFCDLKGIPRASRAAVVDNALEAVKLFDVGDNMSASFSGGMKRRLSVAIATIGDPLVIFLDEPTTGMDPVSKRHVWDFIQELKKDRLVFLTTHSMEEADVLGDRVAIMSGGLLRCIGNSLHLKHRFGDGYRVNIVCDIKYIDHNKRLIAEHMPEARLIAETGEFLVYGMPEASTQRLIQFFRLLESLSDDSNRVKDWGISHTTLEEVFLKVTHDSREFDETIKARVTKHLSRGKLPEGAGSIQSE